MSLPDNILRAMGRPDALRPPSPAVVRARPGITPEPNDNHTHPPIPNTRPQRHEAKQPMATAIGEAKSVGVPHVRFTLLRVRLLDVDAKYASVKDLLDGLAHAGLISGDKEGEITLEVVQEKVAHFAEEKTVIHF